MQLDVCSEKDGLADECVVVKAIIRLVSFTISYEGSRMKYGKQCVDEAFGHTMLTELHLRLRR